MGERAFKRSEEKKPYVREVKEMPESRLPNFKSVQNYKEQEAEVEQGENPEKAPGIKLTKRKADGLEQLIIAVVSQVEKDARDEKSGENKKQLHANDSEPKLRQAPMVEENQDDRDCTETVELRVVI